MPRRTLDECANDPIYRRIDEMALSPVDRERAKASLRNAERLVDLFVAIGSIGRTLLARVLGGVQQRTRAGRAARRPAAGTRFKRA